MKGLSAPLLRQSTHRFAACVIGVCVLILSPTANSRASAGTQPCPSLWECGALPACQPDESKCAPNFADIGQALQCLYGKTRFFTDERWREDGKVLGGGEATFDSILPTLYDSNQFNEADVRSIIRYATLRVQNAGFDRCQAEELLYEASFRMASAHAMFGDDRYLRGTDPGVGVRLAPISQDPQRPSIQLLDARACSDSGALCNVDADCGGSAACVECALAGNDLCYVTDTPDTDVCKLGGAGTDCCLTDVECKTNASGQAEACVYCAPLDKRMCAGDCPASSKERASGAVQEYRRAEQAVVSAARALQAGRHHKDFRRFRELDAQSDCPGGCASNLLIHIGASKVRAQAARLELLQGRAIALGWPPKPGACELGQPSGCSGSDCVCYTHTDCKASVPLASGRCGHPDPSKQKQPRAYVLLREAADEAFSEASVAESAYRALVAPLVLRGHPDLAVIRREEAKLTAILRQTASGLTPFGLPGDFVPFISQFGAESANCTNEAGQSGQIEAAPLSCLLRILDAAGGGELTHTGVLDALAAARADIDNNIAQSLAEMRQEDEAETEIQLSLESEARQLFGTPCGFEGEECSCDDNDLRRGRCARLVLKNQDGSIRDTLQWEIRGLCYADPGKTQLEICGSNGDANGLIEEQLDIIHAKRTAAEGKRDEFDFSVAEQEFIERQYAKRQEAVADACEEKLTSIQQHGNAIAGLIREKKEYVDTGSVWGTILTIGAVVAGAVATVFTAGGAAAAIVAVVAVATTATDVAVSSSTAQTDSGSSPGVSQYASAAASGLQAGANAAEEEEAEDNEKAMIETDAKIHEEQVKQQLEIEAANCVQEQILIGVNAEDALVQNVKERLSLRNDLRQMELEALAALGALNRLRSELSTKLQALAEMQRINDIWRDAQFRNPFNYRLLALQRARKERDLLSIAQLITWVALRSSAYNNAIQDHSFSNDLLRSDALRITNCGSQRCTNSPEKVCTQNSECGNDGVCQPSPQFVEEGAECSVQAVFAARSAEDLGDLLNATLTEGAVKAFVRERACADGPGGFCRKTISLKNILTDPLSDRGPRTLAEVLSQRPLYPVLEASADGDENSRYAKALRFSIVLDPSFTVCPAADSDRGVLCNPRGRTGINRELVDGAPSYGSGGGTLSPGAGVWGERLVAIRGQVRLRGDLTNTNQCRDTTGRPVEGLGTCEGRCAGCQVTALVAEGAPMDARLRLLGPAYMRTDPRESQGVLAVRMRQDASRLLWTNLFRGNLQSPERMTVAPVDFEHHFTITSTSSTQTGPTGVRGAPLASNDWELELLPSFATANYISHAEEAYFDLIDDITLDVDFQAFVP